MLDQEGFTGRICCFEDNMQGYILLYGDDEFSQRLEKIIGKQDICRMKDK